MNWCISVKLLPANDEKHVRPFSVYPYPKVREQ